MPLRLDHFNNSSFDRGASKVVEAAWILVKLLFFMNPFPWPSALRTFFIRLFGGKVGKSLVIRSMVNITFPWRFECGDHVWIGDEALILSLAQVTLESHVCLSQRAFLCTGSHDWRKESFDLKTKPIRIETGSWVAAQAFIGPGTVVGAGSVVTAGAVLLRSVPALSFVRGNPAQVTPKDNV